MVDEAGPGPIPTSADLVHGEAKRQLELLVREQFSAYLRTPQWETNAGREYLAVEDAVGTKLTIRVDAVALAAGRATRNFINTTSENHVIQLSDDLELRQVRAALSAEINNLLEIRRRADEISSEGLVPSNRIRSSGLVDPASAVSASFSDPDLTMPFQARDATGRLISRQELPAAVANAVEERARHSAETLAELRREAESLPSGRYPSRKLMIGGGAALAGRDPDILVVDARGRWHVDPIKGIVQSADQARHIAESGLGDPYQFASPRERIPLDAIRLWEDSAAIRGAVVNGHGQLTIDDQGRMLARLDPLDGSSPVTVEVDGIPIIATGLPPEIVPGCARTVPTVPEALDVLIERLHDVPSLDSPSVRDQLRNLPWGEGSAATALEILAESGLDVALQSFGEERVSAAMTTLSATAIWDDARASAPNRVLYGDQVGTGEYDPLVAKEWLLAGIGGAAIANAEIILQANPEARVRMVGSAVQWVLENDAQYLAMRRQHDPELGGDGRLLTYQNRRLGQVEMHWTADGEPRFRATDVEGEAYVACLGRVARLPDALEACSRWAQAEGGQVRGELMFDGSRQYLGYQLTFETAGASHEVTVTGAASRLPPPDVFSAEDIERVNVAGLKEAPAESGNVAAGFMATAMQSVHLRAHRASNSATPLAPTGQETVRHRLRELRTQLEQSRPQPSSAPAGSPASPNQGPSRSPARPEGPVDDGPHRDEPDYGR